MPGIVDTTPEQLANAAKLLSEELSVLHYGQIVLLVEGAAEDAAASALLEALRRTD